MGNWNRRWRPRGNYNQELPPSLPGPHRTERYPTAGAPHNSVPSWEQKFCTVIGAIPWHKVVVAKKYFYCHDNVINWNDSAAEEAFHNAKKRFWAEINGLHCDISLPDPDMYVDKVDWNPNIDPELMSDLEREYFNPDEGNDYKAEIRNQKAHPSFEANHSSNDDNPWEANRVSDSLAPKDMAQGWNQLDDSRNSGNVENPWEQSCARGGGTHKDHSGNVENPWEQSCARDGGTHKDNSWGRCGDWNQRSNTIEKSKILDNNCKNPWQRGGQSVGLVNQKVWGDTGNNCWRNRGDNSWGWKQQERQTNEPIHIDTRKSNGGWGSFNGSFRKREGGSYQHQSRYKSARFQGDDSEAGHLWKKERTQKRVTFGFE